MCWLLFYFVWIYFTSFSDSLNYSYVMVFMENQAHKQITKIGSIHLFVGTSQLSVCTGYISTPLLHDNIMTEFKIHGPNGSHFEYDSSLKLENTGLQFNTFVIESTQPLTVIGLNREFPSSDSFLVFSTPNLGVEYFAVSYAQTSGKCLSACQFSMVAIENNTKIRINIPTNPNILHSLTIAANTYTNGETIELSLEQYQSYQIQSEYDITGTQVTGDKPFAMFSGNVKTNLGNLSKDHLAEQLIPVESMGRSFTVLPTPDQSRTTDLLFRVVATKRNTIVNINEESEYKLENAGDWVEISEPHDEYYTVTSNNPIMVMDFLSLGTKLGNTDPCLVMIVPTEQWLTRYFYFALNIYTNYFIVVIEDSDKDGLLLNGIPVTNVVWKQVKTSSLVGGYFKVTDSTNLLTTQFDNVTFAAYVYGRVGVETHCTVAGVDLDPKKVELVAESSTVSHQQDTSVSESSSAVTGNVESSINFETTSLWSSSDQIDSSTSSSLLADSTTVIDFSSSSLDVRSSVNFQSSFSYPGDELFSSSVETSSVGTFVDVTYTTIYASEEIKASSRAPGNMESRSTNVPSHFKSLCRCGCSKTKLNSTETDKIISSIQDKLFVDKQKVSKTVRRKTSARDARYSSTGIGMIGVVFILVLLGALIVLDLPKIYRDYKLMREDVKW